MLEPVEIAYSGFRVSRGDKGLSSSSIDLQVTGSPAPPNESAVLFDCGGTWTLQSEGAGYRLNLYRGGNGVPPLIVCSNEETTKAVIHICGSGVVTGVPDAPLIHPVRYPVDQLLLVNHLALRGGAVIHAAGAIVDGRALVFPGSSGAGKSTLSRLLLKGGLDGSLLSDDRVILRSFPVREADSHGAEAWGTPWPSDAGVAGNAHAPLAGLLFLVKAQKEQIVPLSRSLALRRLVPVVSCPWYSPRYFPGVLETCARIVENVPCYELHFRRDGDVAGLLLEVSPAYH
ncbi:MAG: hypothetical protein JW990_02230 [Thermoleophilia bacterium]|nr:hypothetical protein [Thermoleophilia bacterium]